MKKFNLILVCLLFAGFAFAQEPADTAQTSLLPTDSLGIHPWDEHENEVHYVIPKKSHWSVYLGAGFNVFDGDFTSEKKHGVWFPSLSLGGAYHWNNTWALGAEYKFQDYRVTGSGLERDASIMLKGMAHQANFYCTFDIFNAFRPQNTEKVFALDVIVGGGAFLKKNSIYFPNTYKSNVGHDFRFTMTTGTDVPQADEKYKAYGIFFGGLSAEFNINRSFQLGLRGIYGYTTSDEIDGRPVRGQNNDGIFDCEAILRYKIVPRDKSNVRNFMTDEQIDNWNNGIYYKDPNVGAAKYAKNAPKPLKDTIYAIYHDTVWMIPPTSNLAEQLDKSVRNFVVFFENDVPELDKVALHITGEAAMLLQEMPEYYAVVVGSCDNTGAVDYNKWLATQRAINVTNALMNLGVDSNRVYLVGRGIMQDDREEGSYDLNRRVEIHIVTAEGMQKEKNELMYFEQYKKVKRGSAVRKAGEGKNASSSEILKEAIRKMKNGEIEYEEPVDMVVPEAPAEKVKNKSISENDILEKIIVPQDATLAMLAKFYYSDAKKWPIIFEANRDRLSSPDQLRAGDELIIPKLQ